MKVTENYPPRVPSAVSCPCGWWCSGDPDAVDNLGLDHAARCALTIDNSGITTWRRSQPAGAS